ncbi:MAG: DNA mismatch repair protein MutS [Psychroflexus sp.]|nr:DNA mismatch repair protein MutS [Psychroflexus sp.]
MQTQVYEKKIAETQSELKKVKSKLMMSSLIRLLIFLLTIFAIYWFWGSARFIIGSIFIFIVLFLILVVRHQKIVDQKTILSNIIAINQNEIHALHGDYSVFENGVNYTDPTHEYSHDIDLFGVRSFFQFLNRTALKEGEQKLANLLISNDQDNIVKKQKAIQELAEKVDYRQLFSAEAMRVETQTSTKGIHDWVSNYKAFVPQIMRWLPTVFSVLSFVVVALYFFDVIKVSQLLLWMFIGLITVGIYVKKTTKLYQDINRMQSFFQSYQKLISHIEDENFEADLLKELQSKIKSTPKASERLREINRAIDGFEQRNNLLLGIFLNAFLLWDAKYTYIIEQWIANNKADVSNWFYCIAEFDAYHSLANLAYNKTTYNYPDILNENSEFVIKSHQAVHPLLDEKVAVKNDFNISSQEFLIVTGANMAGKSTFLRTLSLQILMSNLGLPVRAESSQYRPVKLITSMRTSDSLMDESSYFYAELSRLKYIIDHSEKENYFIILDEILKGTNSKDKAEGSKKYVERLLQTSSHGVIATHDLSLCTLEEQHKEITNYHFDADITDDNLSFDYRLKPGICQNMNASFLMKKMNIV